MYRRIILLIGFICASTLFILNYQDFNHFHQSLSNQKTDKVINLTLHTLYKNYHFDQSENVINIGIQPLWTPGVITEVMKRDQLLKQALLHRGMTVRFHPFFKGADVNYFLQRGDLDAGVGGDMPAISLCAKEKIVISSLIEQGFSTMLSKSIVMTSDLKDKSIAYAFGSIGHRMLLTLLDANELKTSDVRMIALDVNKMSEALKNDKIDAFVAWEPISTLTLLENPKYLTVARAVTTGYLYFSHAFANKHSQAVNDIVASQLRAMEWLRLDKANLQQASRWVLDEMKEMTGESSKLSETALSFITQEGLIGTASMGKIVDRSLKIDGRLFQQFKFLQSVGEVEGSVSWQNISECFDQSYINKVLLSKSFYQLNSFALENGSQADE